MFFVTKERLCKQCKQKKKKQCNKIENQNKEVNKHLVTYIPRLSHEGQHCSLLVAQVPHSYVERQSVLSESSVGGNGCVLNG